MNILASGISGKISFERKHSGKYLTVRYCRTEEAEVN